MTFSWHSTQGLVWPSSWMCSQQHHRQHQRPNPVQGGHRTEEAAFELWRQADGGRKDPEGLQHSERVHPAHGIWTNILFCVLSLCVSCLNCLLCFCFCFKVGVVCLTPALHRCFVFVVVLDRGRSQGFLSGTCAPSRQTLMVSNSALTLRPSTLTTGCQHFPRLWTTI